jgi:hypothetical protein
MPVLTRCPHCRHEAEVSRSAAAHRVACEQCGKQFDVPLGAADLLVEWGVGATGTRIAFLPGQTLTIGRAIDNDVMLPGEHVSRHHAELRWEGAEWRIHDRGTPNGVMLDGNRVDVATLVDGRRFNIGGYSLHIAIADGTHKHASVDMDPPPGGAEPTEFPTLAETSMADANDATRIMPRPPAAAVGSSSGEIMDAGAPSAETREASRRSRVMAGAARVAKRNVPGPDGANQGGAVRRVSGVGLLVGITGVMLLAAAVAAAVYYGS